MLTVCTIMFASCNSLVSGECLSTRKCTAYNLSYFFEVQNKQTRRGVCELLEVSPSATAARRHTHTRARARASAENSVAPPAPFSLKRRSRILRGAARGTVSSAQTCIQWRTFDATSQSPIPRVRRPCMRTQRGGRSQFAALVDSVRVCHTSV